MKSNRTEKGQVLVLIVLSIVVLFGFAALAVDLSRTYAERRRAQNAADASAFAAAFAVQNEKEVHNRDITDPELKTLVETKAEANGFVGDTGADPRVTVEYYHPPISGPYKDNKEYHQVFIGTIVDQAFSQVIFSGTQRLRVEAVARSRPPQSIVPGDAVFASDPDACQAIQFSGTGGSIVIGGNVFSNSAGNGSCAALERNGSGDITVEPPYDILSVGPWENKGGGGSASPAPEPGQSPKQMPTVPLPDCGSPKFSDRTFNKSNSTLSPGRYAGGISITNGDYEMLPGIYCLYSTFHVNGGSLVGNGVMIVQWSGDIDFNGNATIDLSRPNDTTDNANQHWGGMLIYMPYSNNGGVDLSGNGGTSYTGTVYAPGPRGSGTSKLAKCRVTGTSGSIGLNSNLICSTIEVGGTGDVYINYVQDQNYRLPPIVELAQ